MCDFFVSINVFLCNSTILSAVFTVVLPSQVFLLSRRLAEKMDNSSSGSLMFVQVVFAIIVRQSIKAYLTLSGITGVDCALSRHFTYGWSFVFSIIDIFIGTPNGSLCGGSSGSPGHKVDSFWRRQKWKLLPLPRVSMNQQWFVVNMAAVATKTQWIFSLWYLSYFLYFSLERVISWVEDTCVMSNKLSSKPSKKDRPRSTGKIIFTPQCLCSRLLLQLVSSQFLVKISRDKFKLPLESDLSRIYSLKKKPNPSCYW